MRAVLVGAGQVEVRDRPVPEPGPGQVLVRLRAAALDRVDGFLRTGSHAMVTPEPTISGRDLSGVVVRCGAGVSGLRPGDRVFGTAGSSHAEYVVAEPELLMPLPEGWSDVEAAALPTAGRTAYAAVHRLARPGPGDRVLVTAAGGAVGSAAVQLAVAQGCEVVATVGADWKAARARALGAGQVLRHDVPGWAEGLSPVAAVIDTVGTATWQEALRALRPGGTLVACGVSAGHRHDLHAGRLMVDGHRLVGIGRPSRAVVVEHLHATLASFVRSGLRPVVDWVLPLSRAEEAYTVLENSEFFGRIILVPDSRGGVQ